MNRLQGSVPTFLLLGWAWFGLVSPAFAMPEAMPPGANPAPSREVLDRFEKEVRPLLVEHCQRCHGAAKQQGGLRLDTAEGLNHGTDGESILNLKEPANSRLMQAIRRTGDYPMPPSGPLPEASQKILVAWIEAGAPFPSGADATLTKPVPSGQHWAFQPMQQVEPPAGPDPNPIDRFLAAKLQQEGLNFAAPASKATLIRRAYYDLLGLPPTKAEVDAFLADSRPDAYEQLIDRLLASPHYGERWARWWLDLARYADSKGYVFNQDRNYPYAYTFRDYVIRSLNEDKPYDRFVQEQLAADQLDLAGRKENLAAMGFLTVGRRFINNIHDIIDDRIDVVTRGLMGLTVQCARCHDHKFDPVKIQDYYSLYAVFNASTEPQDNYPIIADVQKTAGYEAFKAQVEAKELAIAKFRETRYAAIQRELQTAKVIQDYLKASLELFGQPKERTNAAARERNLRPAVLARYREQIAAVVPKRLVRWYLHPAVLAKLAESYSAAAQLVGPPRRDQLPLARLYGPEAPLEVPFSQFEELILRDDRTKLTNMKRDIDRMKASSEFNPPRAMVLYDVPNPPEQRVFLRGNPGNPGPVVPRQFISLSDRPAKPFTRGSGRLELAQAITDPSNPLTTRVLVNRVWLMHFGQGLVTTPSDFGYRSERPSHPELLDWLSLQFQADGWSLKQLHKRIMTSRAYQQSAQGTDVAKLKDPENRWLSHANRRRLDFESLRDSLLAVSGQLDRTLLGRSVDLFGTFPSHRRAVYGLIDRQNFQGTFRNFDVPPPDTHSPQRFLTTVPQQALFLLNSPFVLARANHLASRVDVLWQAQPARRVEKLYALILQRPPTDAERELAVGFLKSEGPTGLSMLAQVLLCSNEFAFVD